MVFMLLLAAFLALVQHHVASFDHGPLLPEQLGVMPATSKALTEGLCTTGPPSLPIVELTIAEAHAALLEQRTTCSDLLAAHLQRIAAYDQRTQLNAVLALNSNAQARAAELDIELNKLFKASSSTTTSSNGTLSGNASSDRTLLPSLFCVPVMVKDNIDFAGMPTTAASVALADNWPLTTSHILQKLSSKGAIIIGKSNMGELAFFPAFCVNSLRGAVRNPYHLSYTSSGSSGGSAAGVAASFAIIGLGTDTGNSIRGPASHQALVGLRPSLGLIGRSGIVPLRFDRDTVGPLTRTVTDAAHALNAMVGVDPGDNMTQLLSNVSLPSDYTTFLNASSLQGSRIGVLTQILQLPGADSDIQRLFSLALRDMRAAGAELIEDFRIRGNSLGNREWDANRGGEGPALGHWFVNGRYEDLWACQAPLRVGVDAYLSQGNTTRRHSSLASIYSSGEYHPLSADDIGAALRADYEIADWPPPALRQLGYVCGCGPYWEDPCRSEFRKRFLESMDLYGVDAVIYPTWSRKPLIVGQLGSDNYYDGNNSPMIAPHVGAPALTVPMGYTEEGQLPAGLQLLGRPFAEGKLLGLGFAYEQSTLHRRPPSLFKECTGMVSEEERTNQVNLAG